MLGQEEELVLQEAQVLQEPVWRLGRLASEQEVWLRELWAWEQEEQMGQRGRRVWPTPMRPQLLKMPRLMMLSR